MPQLPPERQELYDRLESQVRGTSLYEIQHIYVPNNCRIFCKQEHLQPTGSHYDRMTVRLIRGLEERGDIKPGGQPLAESTTGSSGASFAWMCRVLGYECTIFIPEDMPAARIEQIKSFGAQLNPIPRGKYIGGLVQAFQSFLFGGGYELYYSPNHSKDEEFGPEAMRDLGREILHDLNAIGVARPDYFVCALGNGISACGVGDALLSRGTQLIGMEPFESPTVLREQFPERYADLYPNPPTSERHQIYGTGPGTDADFTFPNITRVAPLLKDIKLPKPEDWIPIQRQLQDLEAKHVGNSSAACLSAALDLADSIPTGSTILTIFYDAFWRYLPIKREQP